MATKKVKKKAEDKIIQAAELSSEKLGLMLGNSYQEKMRIDNNIKEIIEELTSRIKKED